jgi:hypothetical protein
VRTPKEKVGIWNQAGETRLRAEMQVRDSPRVALTPAIIRRRGDLWIKGKISGAPARPCGQSPGHRSWRSHWPQVGEKMNS